jgi:hypothetical protein
MKASRVSILAAIIVVMAGTLFVGPLVRRSFGLNYTGCVSTSECAGIAPPGCTCTVVYQDSGSQGASSGISATSSMCAYVSGQNLAGWTCGSSIPSNSPAPCGN